MKTKFTVHFLNYIINHYKIYKFEDYIPKNFFLLRDQLSGNTINFLSKSDILKINETRFYDYFFLKDKQIIVNESNIPNAHGINELKIRTHLDNPKLLISKINNDFLPILNSLKNIYSKINPSFFKLKTLQLFEMNYKLEPNDSLYFKYLSRIHYTYNSNIDFSMQRPAAVLLLFEKLLDLTFRSILSDFESTNSLKIDSIINEQRSGLPEELILSKKSLIDTAVILDTKFSNNLTSLLVQNVLDVNNQNLSSEYYRLVYDLIIPQVISSDKLKTKYLSVKFFGQNEELIDKGIVFNIPNNTQVQVIHKETLVIENITVEILRDIFGMDGHIFKIQEIFNSFLKSKVEERYYSFIGYQFMTNLKDWLVAHFSIHDYGLISSQLIDNVVSENLIDKYIYTRLKYSTESVVTQLEYIAHQFNDDPMQFFNCHFFIYDKFLARFKDNLQLNTNLDSDPDTDTTLTLQNIQSLLLNLSIDNYVVDGKSPRQQLFNLLKGQNSDFVFDNQKSKITDIINQTLIVENSCWQQYILWIDEFINSEEFISYLLVDFIPQLIKRSKINNPLSNQKIIPEIDSIRKYFKVALIEEVLKSRLFNNVTESIKKVILYNFGSDFGNSFGGVLKNETNENLIILDRHIKNIDLAETTFKTLTIMDLENYHSGLFDFYVSSQMTDVFLSILDEYVI